MSRFKRALSRAKHAALFAAIGGGIGGVFGRNTASSGAAIGALVGAIIGEQRAAPESFTKNLKGKVSERLPSEPHRTPIRLKR